ncbi:MAG: hypothetical protein ACI4WT_11740 [Oligosphaeraceae bacterium]
MPSTTVNPLALPAGDALRMLRRSGCPQMSDETLQRLIDDGLPLNADGTLNIIEYTAWMLKEAQGNGNQPAQAQAD